MQDTIKFISLGGLDENGKNMYCFEINDDIYIVDCGIKYPESQNLGIDIEIPSFDYVLDNADRVKGIFLTHAHPDAMGAIAYLINELNVPIYASHLTAWIVEDTLKKANVTNYTMRRIKENSIIKMPSGLKVHTFKTTHSIIQSLGIAFDTTQGFLVFTSDYIIDFSAKPQFRSDVSKLTEIGKKEVLALFTESVSASRPGFTAPNHRMKKFVEPIISQAKGRIIITAYTHSLFNIQEIGYVAAKYGYKILIYNRELADLVHKHHKLGFDIFNPETLAKPSDIDKGNVMIFISGNGKDLFETLSNIAEKADEGIKPTSSDTFIIASPAIPGVEHVSIKAIDDISRLDSDVYILSSKNISSMHASQEDLKMMISILNPKYYIPVKGEYSQLMDNGELGLSMDIPKENIVVLENGQQISFVDKTLQEEKKSFSVGSSLIEGKSTNDTQTVVLKDRETLSNEGTVIIAIGLDRQSKEPVTSMDVQTRGFIYIKDSEYIIDGIKHIVERTLENADLDSDVGYNDTKTLIRSHVQQYIKTETGKEPIILTMILTV